MNTELSEEILCCSDLISMDSDEDVFIRDGSGPITRFLLRRHPALRRRRPKDERNLNEHLNLNVHIPPFKGIARPLLPFEVNTTKKQNLAEVLSTQSLQQK